MAWTMDELMRGALERKASELMKAGVPEDLAVRAASLLDWYSLLDIIDIATDTGRWGPIWTADGKPCTENNEVQGCQNHPGNQLLVIAKGEGLFSACAAPEIPLSTDSRRPGSRCGLCRIVAGESECQ